MADIDNVDNIVRVTHYEGCWRSRSHHACTVAEVEQLQAELSRVRQDAQDQSDEVQELWLSPCEAEGLKQRLAEVEQRAEELERKQRKRDEAGDPKLNYWFRRFRATEVALANCGLTGIYYQFDGPADAIEQMVGRLIQLEGGQVLQNERQLRQEAGKRAEALAALVTPEWVNLLEFLGDLAADREYYKTAESARALAARIREALEETE